jgi:hypothetical protein
MKVVKTSSVPLHGCFYGFVRFIPEEDLILMFIMKAVDTRVSYFPSSIGLLLAFMLTGYTQVTLFGQAT